MKRFGIVLSMLCVSIAMLFVPSFAQDPFAGPTAPATKTTMNKMLDEAADKLPPLRQRIVKRILKSKEGRAELVDLAALKLSENPACKDHVETFNSATFTGDTEMAINPDNLKIIIDALMKLILILIQLFFKV